MDKFAQQWDEIAKTDICNEAIATGCNNEDKFNESGKESIKPLIEILDKYGLNNPNLKFLELGCGAGRETQYLLNYFPHIFAVDSSEEMIKKVLVKFNYSQYIMQNNGEDLREFSNDMFDIVYSNIVLQHCPQDIVRKYFKETERVLKQGGYFIFQLHTGKEHKEPADFRSYGYWTCDEIRECLKNFEELSLEETGDLCKLFIFKKK